MKISPLRRRDNGHGYGIAGMWRSARVNVWQLQTEGQVQTAAALAW